MDLSEYGLVPHHSATVKNGVRFGRLTVLAVGKPPGSYRYQAVCKCDCGLQTRPFRVDHLSSGRSTNCGCVRREKTVTHGLAKHPLFNRWHHMMDRCYKPSCKAFPDYGGRGISVCKSWHQVENFVHDLEHLFSPGLELDRIDNNGHYELSNVRFAPRAINADNKRSNVELTFNGKTQSIARWAEEIGLSYGTLWSRIQQKGWTIEKALTTPAMSSNERMAIARAVKCNRL